MQRGQQMRLNGRCEPQRSRYSRGDEWPITQQDGAPRGTGDGQKSGTQGPDTVPGRSRSFPRNFANCNYGKRIA